MPRIRDFSPGSLDRLADQRLRIPWLEHSGLRGKAWSFTIFFPRFLITAEGTQETICTNLDEELLQDMLVRHFGGCTANQNPIQGIGRRGNALETNVHHMITVLASRWRGTQRYFRALRRELEESSGEEQVLILRQDHTIA